MRRLGFDSDSGKPAYAVPEPGGVLETLADVAALETATVWHALAEAMVDAPEELTADEASFVLARVVECLGEVLPIAIRAVAPKADALEPFMVAGREIADGLRPLS